LFETEKRGLRGRRPGGEASVLEVDSDVAVHTDLNLDAGAGVGDPMRIGLELDALVADPDGVVRCDDAFEPEREQGVEVGGAVEFAKRATGFRGLWRLSRKLCLKSGS